MRTRRWAALCAGTLLLSACGSDEGPSVPTLTQSPATSPGSSSPGSSSAPAGRTVEARVTGAIATGLEVPWGLDFLPSGDALVTERDTRRVLLVSPDGEVDELGTLDDADPQGGEGGLLGVAVSPDFAQDATAYFYLTSSEDNRVVKTTVRDGSLGETEVVLSGIPAGFVHDGGRITFGPDGLLYVATGETGERELSQDRDSLAGKILRITPDGKAAAGNPFDSPVWSWGHRNVQGLAFDDEGRLWASEFGDSTWDELNLIRKGANYGWPEIEGTGGGPDFVDPVTVWPTSEASPSGLAYAEGSLWMAGLRGNRLWQVPLDGESAGAPVDLLVGEYGRLRSVALAPDGSLWVTTSNRDGRGEPGSDDDQILRVELSP